MLNAKRSRLSSIVINGSLALICLIWIIPTLGLFISSFRPRDLIAASGWWAVLPHQEWLSKDTLQLTEGLDLDQPIKVGNATVSDDQLRAGVVMPDGTRLKWFNRRARQVSVEELRFTMSTQFTLQNYDNVLTGAEYEYSTPDGSKRTEKGDDMSGAFLSSVTVAVPATVIPILIAAFAAYAFAWMRFPGRRVFFAIVVAMLSVPLQIALIPILRDYTALNLNGTYLAVWLAHTGFGLALAIYLLYNYISQLPRETLEAAFIDGASQFTIFRRLILPLSVPALASFAIFQFLWVWNDYLVALIFIGAQPNVQVLTMRLANIVGTRGQDWHLLTAGAFISMLLPLMVFFSLQRYFVRGLLAGSVKG